MQPPDMRRLTAVVYWRSFVIGIDAGAAISILISAESYSWCYCRGEHTGERGKTGPLFSFELFHFAQGPSTPGWWVVRVCR